MADQQKYTVKVSKKYGEAERLAIGLEVIDLIIERTAKGEDKTNTKFSGYSDAYKNSFDFKLSGKGSTVNLNLSGEMLGAIEVLDVKGNGEIVIGIPKSDSENNAKAEGNIKGTYGQKKPIKGKARDFMGISRKDLKVIKDKYPIKTQAERDQTRFDALDLVLASEIATGLVDELGDSIG